MKKILLLITILLTAILFAQCNIIGNPTIKVLDEQNYSVPKDLAQCNECHLWLTVGENLQILTNNKLNNIKIKAISGGRSVLSLSVLTKDGFMQCSKNIDILDSSETGIAKNNGSDTLQVKHNNTKCDIEVNNYKEVKYSENIVSFFPNVNTTDFRYEWTVTYATGETMNSTEKIPQFPFTKEKSITTVKLKIISAKCVREFSKTYDSNYWKWF